MEDSPVNGIDDNIKSVQPKADENDTPNNYNPPGKDLTRAYDMELIERFILESLEEHEPQSQPGPRHAATRTKKAPVKTTYPATTNITPCTPLPGNTFTQICSTLTGNEFSAAEMRFFAEGEAMTEKNLIDTQEIEDFIAQCPEWFPLERPRNRETIIQSLKKAITKLIEPASAETPSTTATAQNTPLTAARYPTEKISAPAAPLATVITNPPTPAEIYPTPKNLATISPASPAHLAPRPIPPSSTRPAHQNAVHPIAARPRPAPPPLPPFTGLEAAFFKAGEEISRQNTEAQKAIEAEIAAYPEMYPHLLNR